MAMKLGSRAVPLAYTTSAETWNSLRMDPDDLHKANPSGTSNEIERTPPCGLKCDVHLFMPLKCDVHLFMPLKCDVQLSMLVMWGVPGSFEV